MFVGCGEDTKTTSGDENSTTETTSKNDETSTIETNKNDTEVSLMINNFDQFAKPNTGDEVAVLHTTEGDIYIRLFPEIAPKAVENFKGLIKNGYYDGIIFHRVINDFMIQGGDPTGTGMGGESLWGGKFEDEFTNKAFNFRGSLAMANAGPNTNGSQFFINQAGPQAGATATSLKRTLQMYGYKIEGIDDQVFDAYAKIGGNMHLDGVLSPNGRGHTVFGQVYDGMDVVDKIAAAKVNANDKPIETISIKTAEIIKY
ncbi:MAG: peptidylprolyl isomerase [Clostridia bacterium]|nr:peptidylprolyl isomerase [Clostridia bacterium]